MLHLSARLLAAHLNEVCSCSHAARASENVCAVHTACTNGAPRRRTSRPLMQYHPLSSLMVRKARTSDLEPHDAMSIDCWFVVTFNGTVFSSVSRIVCGEKPDPEHLAVGVSVWIPTETGMLALEVS